MKYIVRKKIEYNSVMDIPVIKQVKESVYSDKVRDLIDSKKVLHSEELGIFYYLCECYTYDNFMEKCLELRIVINVVGYDNRYNGKRLTASDLIDVMKEVLI